MTIRRSTKVSSIYSDQLQDADRLRVAKFIEQIAGIQLPAAKHSLVEARLRKRQRNCGFTSLADYIDFALGEEHGREEQIHLLDALTTNKTDFYREPEHFFFLSDFICTQLKINPLRWTKQAPLRLWSAGCSSGEEPYTLAIELLEISRIFSGFHFTIEATDISVSCLKKARSGIYDHKRIDAIRLDLRKRYLLRSRRSENDIVRMSDEVRERVQFKSFNLLTDRYERQNYFDIIFCRNVMIYFNSRDRSKIVQRFAHSMKPDGIFFIGHSEALVESQTLFERLRPTVYLRKSIGGQS